MLDQFNPSVAFVKQKRHEFRVFYVHIINISLINDSNRTEEKKHKSKKHEYIFNSKRASNKLVT